MSGKLAWSIGIALALIGVAMFAMTFMMRDPKSVKDTTAKVPSSIPSRKTNEDLTADRRKVSEDLASRQAEIRKLVGANDNVIIDPDYRAVGGIDFLRQTWPQEKGKLEARLKTFEVKPPRWNQNGTIDTRPAIDPAPFGQFDDLLKSYSENSYRVGRLAATAMREFIFTAEAEVNAVKAERVGAPAPVFELIKFDLNADNARFSEAANSDVYGQEDAYIRRNFMVEFVADPILSDRIVRAFYSRQAKAPMMRVVRVSKLAFDTPTSIVAEVTRADVRTLILTDQRIATRVPELIDLVGNPEKLDDWLKKPENFDKVKVEFDVDPNVVRPALPTRTKLKLQLCEIKPDAKILQPLEKANEGLPEAQVTQ